MTVPAWRRRVSWTACGIVLLVIGVALYLTLPPAPRWSDAGRLRTLLNDEGPALATCMQMDGRLKGPLQLWDVETGHEVERFLEDSPPFLAHGQSHDDRLFVAVLADPPPRRRIAWVDLHERKAWHVTADLDAFESYRFARNGRHLAVRQRQVRVAEAAYTVLDTTTGRVLARMTAPCKAPVAPSELGGWSDSGEDGLFSDDGRWFAVNHVGADRPATALVDTQNGATHLIPDARLCAFVPTAHILLAERDQGGTWIWDLTASDWRAPLEGDAPDHFCFSPDGRWLACVPPKQKQPVAIRFFDLRSGRLHWELQSITCGSEEIQEETFSPDGRYFILPTESAHQQRHIALYDVEAKRVRWERTATASYGACFFTADSSILISALPTRVEVSDAATGEVRFTVDIPHALNMDPLVSRDRRTLYVYCQPLDPEPTLWDEWMEDFWPWRRDRRNPPSVVLFAYDLASGRQLWRQETPFALQTWFAPDRVVTLQHQYDGPEGAPIATKIQCWDIPPRRRLEWIIGVPLGIGVLLLLVRAVMRRRRRSATTATT